MKTKTTVLVTGCSDGGLGSALALALHANGGYRVIATARNLAKLSETRAAGIEEMQLDVLSDTSINACVEQVTKLLDGRLDMLINNAGAGYMIPVLDADIDEAKKLFDLNVWSLITTSRAFLPLLQRGTNPKLVNNISAVAYAPVPIQGIYNASKAAANLLTENLRVELRPFGIRVIALITGSVKTNFFNNSGSQGEGEYGTLPDDSIFNIVPGGMSTLGGNAAKGMESAISAATWAREVTYDLSKTNPPFQIWRGSEAAMVRWGTHFPTGMFDDVLMKRSKLDEIEKMMKQRKKQQ